MEVLSILTIMQGFGTFEVVFYVHRNDLLATCFDSIDFTLYSRLRSRSWSQSKITPRRKTTFKHNTYSCLPKKCNDRIHTKQKECRNNAILPQTVLNRPVHLAKKKLRAVFSQYLTRTRGSR